MSTEFEQFLRDCPDLLPEESPPRKNGRRFPICLPSMPEEREFSAWLILPREFPDEVARISLSPSDVLRIPHVEGNALLCLDQGDPGPSSGVSEQQRIEELLYIFYEQFLSPWVGGRLDGDFASESQNYWAIHVARSPNSVVRRIYTLNPKSESTQVYEATLLLPGGIVLAGDQNQLANRFKGAFSSKNSQEMRVEVAEISIPTAWPPNLWPRSLQDIDAILDGRLSEDQLRKFQLRDIRKRKSRRETKKRHPIVIFRAPGTSYGFLLPGGPQGISDSKQRSAITTNIQPLMVERIDPSWICGRDQHKEVLIRQTQHVLVLGAGALGSPVIDQLAMAGVGRISVVDPDYLSASNLGRHHLGAESLSGSKAKYVAAQIQLSRPTAEVVGYDERAQTWLEWKSLNDVDLIIDLTGEPIVRWQINQLRRHHPIPLLIGWMEPFVAAAHACMILGDVPWMLNYSDPMEKLQAVVWPSDVIQQEPGCSSRFQSYTPAAATHAVALVSEASLDLLDGKVERSLIRSWVRGQKFLDMQRSDLKLRSWAVCSSQFDGLIIERDWSSANAP